MINVPANINKFQSILPRLSNNDTIIEVIIKHRLQYKSPFMSRNGCPNIIMFALKDLLNNVFYKEFNVKIHHVWYNFLRIHVNTKT